jgi:hypothetical protein
MFKFAIASAILLMAGMIMGSDSTVLDLCLGGDFNDVWTKKWICHEKGAVKQVDGGRSGQCLEVKTSEKPVVFREREFIPLADGKDTVRIVLYVKGKGSFSIVMPVYNKDNKGVSAKGVPCETVTVNSPDEWLKKEFVFSPASQDNNPENAVAKYFIMVKTFPGGSLRYDDIEGVVERKSE